MKTRFGVKSNNTEFANRMSISSGVDTVLQARNLIGQLDFLFS